LLDRNESDKLIYSPRRKTITSELKVKLNEFEKYADFWHSKRLVNTGLIHPAKE
jgi:hypothetical protein